MPANGPPGLRKSFALFVLAATVGFIIDAGVVTVLVRWFAWGAWQGRFVSFPLAVTATWWLNRRYAFRGTGRADRRVEYAAYWAIQLAGAVVNFGIYGLCSACGAGTRGFSVRAGSDRRCRRNAVQLRRRSQHRVSRRASALIETRVARFVTPRFNLKLCVRRTPHCAKATIS